MTKITRILHMEKRVKENGDEFALINVELDHGGESVAIVGGEVEDYFNGGQPRVFVKRGAGQSPAHLNEEVQSE